MPRRPDIVVTERLELRPVPPDDVAAIVAGRRRPGWAEGYPTDGDAMIAALLAEHPAALHEPHPLWSHRQVREHATGLAVGGIGFVAPPLDGAVEVGYAIAASRRRRGYAGEALAAMLAVAWSDPDVRTVVATTEADNLASQRVLERAGFTLAGRGADLRYELRRPVTPES